MTFWAGDKRKKSGRWGFDEGLVAPKWEWFWDKSYVLWPFLEGQGLRTFSTGKHRITGTLQADTEWLTTRFGPAVDGTTTPTDSRILIPDNTLMRFVNDFSITVMFFDDAVTPAGVAKYFCGKVSADFNDYIFSYDHGAQTFIWRAGGVGRQISGPGGPGGIDFLHGKLNVLTVVQHPIRGKELWINGELILSDTGEGDDVPGGTNTFALLARGDTTGAWDNGPIYGIYFHQPALIGPENALLFNDPFGPFRMAAEEPLPGSDILIAAPTDSLIPILKRRRR